MSHRRCFLLLLLAVVFCSTTAPLWRTAPSNNDDIRFANTVRESYFAAWRDLAHQSVVQGRPHFLKALTYPLPFLVDDLTYYRAVMILAALLNVVLFGILVRQLLGSWRLAGLAVVVLCLTLQDHFDFPAISSIPTAIFSFSFLLGSLVLFCSACDRGRGARRRSWVSAGLLFLAQNTIELYVLYAPLFGAIALLRGKRPGEALRLSAPHLLVTAAYLVEYVLVKKLSGGHYAGTTIHLDDGLGPVLAVICSFSSWAIPGMVFAHPKYQHILQTMAGVPPIWQAIDAAATVKALAISAAIGFLLPPRTWTRARLEPTPPLGRTSSALRVLAVVTLVAAFLAPSVLLALTEHYQRTVAEGQYQGYQVTHFARFPLALAAAWILHRLATLRAATLRLAALGLALLVGAILAVATAYTNTAIARLAGAAYARHEAVRALLESEAYRQVPEGAVIVAPSLFRSTLTLSFEGPPGLSNLHHLDGPVSNYWTAFFRRVGRRSVYVVPRLTESSMLRARPVFFLQHVQPGPLDPRCAAVFARVTRPDLPDPSGGKLLLANPSFGLVLVVPLAEGHAPRVCGEGVDSFTQGRMVFLEETDSCPPRVQEIGFEGAVPALDQITAVREPGLVRRLLAALTVARSDVGFYGDGWMAPVARLRISAAENPSLLTIRAIAPRELARVHVEAKDGDRSVGSCEFGSQEGLVAWMLRIEPGPLRFLDLRADKFFVPAKTGKSDDIRKLSLWVDEIRLEPATGR